MKADETALAHYVRQMRLRVLAPLSEVYGIDVSDGGFAAGGRKSKTESTD